MTTPEQHAQPYRTRAEHYYKRGYNDGLAGRRSVRPSEPQYARGYIDGVIQADLVHAAKTEDR